MNQVINGLNLHYVTTKSKKEDETILFLHGFLGGIFSFKGLGEKLKEHFNTVNLDLPSFGLSDEAPEHFTIYDYAKVVIGLLDALQIKKVNIVAHSFGGRIAIILASIYSDRVNKVVIIDGAGIKPKFSLKVYIKIKWYKFLKTLVKWGLLKKEALNKYGSSDYKQLSHTQKKVFARIVNEDLTYLLEKILVPTLLIWGGLDKDTPLYMAKKIKKRIKDCGLIAFLNAGHYSYLDEPYKVERILMSFF